MKRKIGAHAGRTKGTGIQSETPEVKKEKDDLRPTKGEKKVNI